jgi:RNA recognition motif-containing protein
MSLFVGNVSYDAKADELRNEFEKYGTLKRCEVMKSFAFITFESEEEAESAMNKFYIFSLVFKFLLC